MQQIVIVGASLAGLTAAQTFRRQGFDGTITLVGDEAHYPYDRPPLSKGFLAGRDDEAKIRLRAAIDPDEFGIDWRLGQRAVALYHDGEQGSGRVTLSEGEEIPFDGLVIATGARPRTLNETHPEGNALAGVHLLRSLDDARALRSTLDSRPGRLVVIGAGFIGAEVAATARELGIEVCLVEAAAAPLGRVLDADAGMAIVDLHRSHGVDVRLDTTVADVVGDSGVLDHVVLSDGQSLEASAVVVGIGVVPNTEWIEGSGLTIDDGVVADSTCLAAPGVVVAGDVARWPNRRFGQQSMRIEQWDNALEMGTYAAKRLLAWAEGAEVEDFQPVPWFWSDQYDRKIQLAGVANGRPEVVQGAGDESRFVQIYVGDDDQVSGVLSWNRPRQAVMGRSLIGNGASSGEAREALG